MLVRLISDCYYDTRIGTLGIIIKSLGNRIDASDEHRREDALFVVRFTNNEEEVVWLKDLEIIQEEE